MSSLAAKTPEHALIVWLAWFVSYDDFVMAQL
jgi:hypothetical protein